ncbi:MAG: PKD domain-containing protein [Bacteroidia bacterium]
MFFLRAIILGFVLMSNNVAHAQCTWHNLLVDGYEYTTVCPDVIPGTTYQSSPASWAVHSGTYSLYLNFKDSNIAGGTVAGTLVYDRTIDVCPNLPTRISSWLTTSFAGIQCDMHIKIIDATGAVIFNTPSILVPYYPAWYQYQSGSFTPTTSTVQFLMYTNVGGGGGNDLSMDDFLVEHCYNLNTVKINYGNICQNVPTLDFYPLLTSAPPNSGTWAGPSVLTGGYLGTFNPSTNTSGNYVYTTFPLGTAPACPVAKDTVTITVKPTPSLTLTETDASCGATNGTATITSITGATAPYYILWSGGQTTMFATGLAAGTYTVTVTDGVGCIKVDSIVVGSTSAITASIVSQTNVSCNGGSNGAVTATGNNGSGSYTYLWSSGAGTNASATNLPANTYTVTVTDAGGCTATQSVTITQPTALAFSVSGGTTICIGQNDTISASVSGGTLPYSYLWSNGNTTASQIVSPLTSSTFTVTVSDANGCTLPSQTIIVNVNPPLNVTSTFTGQLCAGDSTTITATPSGGNGGPYTYNWNSGAATSANSIPVIPQNDTTITVTINDGCSASVQLPMNIIVSPPINTSVASQSDVTCFGLNNGSATINCTGGIGTLTYSWSPVGGSGATATGLPANTYTVTINDSIGCTTSQTVVITQPTALTFSLSSSSTICIGQNATISVSASGGTQPYSYLWSNGIASSSQIVFPVSSSTYTITVTDGNGCNIPNQSVTINVHPPLSINASFTSQLCKGDSTTIIATPSGGNGGPYSYSWNNGTTTLSNSMIVIPQNDTTITITLNDGCSPPVQLPINITVAETPVVSFTPLSVKGCVPVEAEFIDSSTSPVGSKYLWSFGDGSTSTLQSPTHVYSNPNQYSVSLVITSPQGCIGSLSVLNLVDAGAQPLATFAVSNSLSIENLPVYFTDLSSIDVTQWQWNFGDSSNLSSLQNPVHSYFNAGTYNISLIVQNSTGCVDTAENILELLGEFSLYIPNAFTPNDDGVNDSFTAYGVNISNFEMRIFNRWGQEVYQSGNLNQPWRGTFKDNETACQDGVYIYKIKASDYYGKHHEYTGSVKLIR